MKILIIEDTESIALVYKRQFMFDGFTVLTAFDGKSGLALAKKELPDLILLDIILPDISGLEVLLILKSAEITKKIPVLAISAFGSDENKTKALSIGALEFIEKENFDPKDISKKIKEVLG